MALVDLGFIEHLNGFVLARRSWTDRGKCYNTHDIKDHVKHEQYTFWEPYRRPNPKAIVKGSVSSSLPPRARNRSG